MYTSWCKCCKRETVFSRRNREKAGKEKNQSWVFLDRFLALAAAKRIRSCSYVCMWSMHERWQCSIDWLEYLMKMLNWWKLFKPLDHQLWWSQHQNKKKEVRRNTFDRVSTYTNRKQTIYDNKRKKTRIPVPYQNIAKKKKKKKLEIGQKRRRKTKLRVWFSWACACNFYLSKMRLQVRLLLLPIAAHYAVWMMMGVTTTTTTTTTKNERWKKWSEHVPIKFRFWMKQKQYKVLISHWHCSAT